MTQRKTRGVREAQALARHAAPASADVWALMGEPLLPLLERTQRREMLLEFRAEALADLVAWGIAYGVRIATDDDHDSSMTLTLDDLRAEARRACLL